MRGSTVILQSVGTVAKLAIIIRLIDNQPKLYTSHFVEICIRLLQDG